MSIAPRQAKCTMPSSTRPGQATLGQKRTASSSTRTAGVPHTGQWSGIANGCFRAVALLPHRPQHLGNHLAGPHDLHPVALTDVLLRDHILVVQGRPGYRHAGEFHRLELGPRTQRTGAAHVDPDLSSRVTAISGANFRAMAQRGSRSLIVPSSACSAGGRP